MDWLFDPAAWIGLATLIVLEIVLGVETSSSSPSLPTSFHPSAADPEAPSRSPQEQPT